MEPHTELDVEKAWKVIVSHLLGRENKDLLGIVDESLKRRASQISDVVKLDISPEEKRTAIDSFDLIGGEYKRKDRSFGEKAYHCPAQLRALKKIWDKVDDIFWKASSVQDELLRKGLLKEDDLRSISDKASRQERNVSIWNFLLGLSRDDLVKEVIPILKENHKHVAEALEQALSVENSGARLTIEEIIDLVNPRKLANSLYKEGYISGASHADLSSPRVSRLAKGQILHKVPPMYFLICLKVEYPHFYDVIVEGLSCREVMEADDFEVPNSELDVDVSAADMEEQTDLKGRETTEGTSSKPTWCFCYKCRMMPSDEEQICCIKEQGKDCLSLGQMMKAITAGGRLLKTDLKWMMPRKQLHRLLRRGLYRQLSVWRYCHLGPKIREPLPSCCVWKIRETIPDPDGQYEGFRASASVPGGTQS